MIDQIYFTLPAGTLDDCHFLPFLQTVETTGELCKWKIAKWGAFVIKQHNYSGRIEVRGSLHKYWSKGHNGGPFPRWAVAQAVEELSKELGFKPQHGLLHGVEFGANVPMPTPAKELLQRALLHSKKGSPAKPISSTYNQRGLMREVEAQQYYLKTYDKEAQLDDSSNDSTGGELIRIELKVCTMEQLKKAGVKTLADLHNLAKLDAMGKILFGQWDSILFAAPDNLPNAIRPTTRPTDRKLLEQAARVGYWDKLPAPQLRVQVKKYRKVFAQCVVDEALDAATQGLRKVWSELLNQPAPASPAVALALMHNSQLDPLCKGLSCERRESDEHTPIITAEGLLVETPISVARASDIKETDKKEKITPAGKQAHCQTCGRPLVGRSPRAKFCSERELGAEAKKCRNADSNPRNNARRRLLKSENTQQLFDTRPFIKLPEQLREFILAA